MQRLLIQLPRPILSWLPTAFIVTVLAGTLYVVVQHQIRSEANYPQIQYAQDLAAQLFNNQTPTASLPTNSVDIEQSLAPFVVLYDANGHPVDGSGKINGQLPTLPSGVFDYTMKHTEDRITWQPQANTRVAAVVRYYQNAQHSGYVLAGRNVKEVEIEENQTLLLTAVGWVIAMIGSLTLYAVTDANTSKVKRK